MWGIDLEADVDKEDWNKVCERLTLRVEIGEIE